MESFIFCAANPSKLQNGLVRALEIHKTPLWIKIASYSHPGKENKRKLKKIIEKDHKLNVGQKTIHNSQGNKQRNWIYNITLTEIFSLSL